MEDRIAAVLAAVPQLQGEEVAVRLLAGGITNHNYRVDTPHGAFVLRMAGSGSEQLGINRAVEYACSRAAAGAGVGAEVIAYLPEYGALITRFVEGRVLTPADAGDPTVLERVVAALRAYHALPPGEGHFSPFETVRQYVRRAQERAVPLPAALDAALRILTELERELRSDEPPCPCHNDLLPANFIDDGQRVQIVDWEYGGMGDRFFDLGNFAVNHELTPEGEALLLERYFGEVQTEHLRRLRMMRLASDMREATWGFLQAGISTLDFDFLAYGQKHLDRFLGAASAFGPSAPASVS